MTLGERMRAALAAPSPYWLTRFVFLRALGFVYLVAFFSLASQLLPLLGSDGLLPIASFLDAVAQHAPSQLAAVVDHPTLFWLGSRDAILLGACWLGVALSLVVTAGYANALVMLALWLLYLSFVEVGQIWFSFGWEYQLLETGFLAVFFCPLLDGRPFPGRPPPRVLVWLLRWLVFRIMLGAGLIKMRGDPCWRELTCLLYHYETQPIPHPLSWYFHNLPPWVQTAGVLFNHLVELVAPFFVFGPRRARHTAGVLLALFQMTLIASGNLSFLNWLTLVAIVGCFDDTFWRRILPRRLVAASERARERARPSRAQRVAVGAYAAVVVVLSIGPVANLLSEQQAMNRSFDPLNLVNTYGAFGTVGRTRDEIVFSGTLDDTIDENTRWVEYEWKCKPGDVMRRPCWATPYHYRLDWLIWFAAMSDAGRHPWTVHLAWKLLHADPGALSLLAGDPFDGRAPHYVRADLYRYEFTRPGDPSGAWWTRRYLRPWLRPLSRDDASLREFLAAYGWETP